MTRSSVCVRPQLDYDMNMRKVATHLCRDTKDSLDRKGNRKVTLLLVKTAEAKVNARAPLFCQLLSSFKSCFSRNLRVLEIVPQRA